MNINIDTDIDFNIRKLDELIEKLKLTEDKTKAIRLITIKEFAEIRNCSLSCARKIYLLPSFPSEDIAKTKVAELNAILNWYSQKRDKKLELLDCSNNEQHLRTSHKKRKRG